MGNFKTSIFNRMYSPRSHANKQSKKKKKLKNRLVYKINKKVKFDT